MEVVDKLKPRLVEKGVRLEQNEMLNKSKFDLRRLVVLNHKFHHNKVNRSGLKTSSVNLCSLGEQN